MRLAILTFMIMLLAAPVAWAHGDEVHEDQPEQAPTEVEQLIPEVDEESQAPALDETSTVPPEAHHHDADMGDHDHGSPPQAPATQDRQAENGHNNDDGHHPDNGHHDEPAGEHDHSSHAHGTWATNSLERGLAWIGKLHPALTNFPIALLIAAFLAEAYSVTRGGTGLRRVVNFLGTWGGLAAAATAAVGWMYVGFDPSADDALLSGHRMIGSLAGLAVMTLSILAGEARPRLMLRLALLIGTGLVAYNGYLGGQMMYGADHYSWPTP